MKRTLGRAALYVFAFVLGALFCMIFSFYHSVPKVKGTWAFPGLDSDVRIIRDRWGVPHIFAQSEKDLFFASGFIQAQDRMWQMELARRAGSGRLSEIIGARTLETDKMMRTLGLKEAVAKDFARLTPQMKGLLQSYCDGVNTWLSSKKWNPPPEFLLLRFRPEPWSIQDSLVLKEMLAVALTDEYRAEIMRSQLVRKLGAGRALQILEEDIGGSLGLMRSLEPMSIKEQGSADGMGSNNWVISGKRTQSGKPLLANDPHLQISLPPIISFMRTSEATSAII